MLATKAYAIKNATGSFEPFEFNHRDPKPHDVVIDILYSGICHSDIHQARNEWNNAIYPMVPGHEIVGRVTAVGDAATKHQVGDLVGIGCMVDSCRECGMCECHEEQFCPERVYTYNDTERDGKTITYGGYANQIVVDENFVLSVSDKLDIKGVAPLLCAGITTYSPLKRHGAGPGKKVGIMGLGGLGHMAVKIAHAMGAEVTVFSHSPAKEAEAKRLGADKFVISKDTDVMETLAGTYDVMLDTVSANHDIQPHLDTLKVDGVYVLIGVPEKAVAFQAGPFINRRRIITSSLIGGIKETQEMLDFCAEHNLVSDVEMVNINQIDEAYERILKADVRYRFVIDMSTLN
tara:strand:+ start:21549 stop:22592 length:1044 start_codon:yes stop_codon:yes gene_type:complete